MLNTSVDVPVEVPIEPAVALTSAGDLTCARLRNGNSSCWGASAYGADGYGIEQPAQAAPVWLPLAGDAESLATSGFHSCAVLPEGEVHCWGANPDDLLGMPNGRCVELATDGTCLSRPGATLLSSGAVRVVTGGFPAVPASSEQDARGPRPLTCALMDSGAVECWGDNSGGGLGTLDAVPDRPRPDLVFDASGSPLRDLVDIAVGADRGYAIDAFGSVWFWGGAVQTGARREDLPNAQHIAVGERHRCLVTAGGAVMCWGDNSSGQAGDAVAASACDPSAESCTVGPTRVPGVERAVQVAVGAHHSCALDLDGRVICWGSNQHQQIGDERAYFISEPVLVPLASKAAQIAIGRGHSCAMLESGAVYCWGLGSSGQLGGRL
jgi:alpha-tubulin suppressor-like RCC1 family protein